MRFTAVERRLSLGMAGECRREIKLERTNEIQLRYQIKWAAIKAVGRPFPASGINIQKIQIHIVESYSSSFAFCSRKTEQTQMSEHTNLKNLAPLGNQPDLATSSAGAGPSKPFTEAQVEEFREQDRWLPVSISSAHLVLDILLCASEQKVP